MAEQEGLSWVRSCEFSSHFIFFSHIVLSLYVPLSPPMFLRCVEKQFDFLFFFFPFKVGDKFWKSGLTFPYIKSTKRHVYLEVIGVLFFFFLFLFSSPACFVCISCISKICTYLCKCRVGNDDESERFGMEGRA